MEMKEDKKHVFLILVMTTLILSAFVGTVAAAYTWHFWDDPFMGTYASDGVSHQLDAHIRRASYGDGSLFVNLNNSDVAWWYCVNETLVVRGLVLEEKKWLADIYYQTNESGTLYIDVYSVGPDGTLKPRFASGSKALTPTGEYIGYFGLRCPDDPTTNQIVPPRDRLAVRLEYEGNGTLRFWYNGPDGSLGETFRW